MAGLCASSLSAVTVVSWGPSPDIVTGQQGSIGGEGSSSIDFNTPSNPAIGSGYYPDNTDHSPVFYFASTSTIGNLDVRILNTSGGGNDEFRMGMNDTTDPFEVDGNIAIVWTKDGDGASHGFLNGGDANPATLTGLNTTFVDNGSSVFSAVDLRWVIGLDDTFYISDAVDYNPTMTLVDPSATSWFAYTPGSDITAIGANASLSSFDNLTAAGFMLDIAASNTGNIYILPEMTSFTAEADVVPEPTTYALGLGAAIFGLIAYYRRRK